jgi:sulfate permease, SulP family
LTGLFEDLPEATLAAVVITALIELVDYRALQALWRAYSSRLGRIYGFAARADFIAAVAAMLGVLVFDTLPGLVIGVADSLLLLYRVSRPHVAVLGEVPGGGQWADTAHHPEDQTTPGVAVLRVESGVFFGNTDHVRDAIEDAATADGTRAVVLDCETMPFVDVTAARMLNQLAADLHRQGVHLVLAGEIGQVRDMVAAVSGHGQAPDYHRTMAEAVHAAQAGPVGQPAEEG